MSSVGPLVLPDQDPGPPTCSQSPCHELIASGKNKEVYVLDRDNMGGYWSNPGCLPPQICDPQILQELALTGSSGELMATSAFWNGILYFAPDGAPIQAFQITNGLLAPSMQTRQKYVGAHAPSISANGSTNGVLWILSGNNLDALDAISLTQLYSTSQSGTRDKFPKPAHFATQTVANGRVYLGTGSTLEAFGLFHIMDVAAGNNQSAPVLTSLPSPIQFATLDPYNGQPISGVTISFSDGNKGGQFNPTSAVTASDGTASTSYTFPKKTGVYTLTASAANFGNATATETATAAAPQKLISYAGTRQTGPAGTVLPVALTAETKDAYGNPVPGVTINFSSNQSGSLNPPSAVTNAKGLAAVLFTLPTTIVKSTVTASSDEPEERAICGVLDRGTGGFRRGERGRQPDCAGGTVLPQSLSVLVTDQYGNPVTGASVMFDDGGAGGSFGTDPATTGSNGIASQMYTLPPAPGPVTITATVAGVSNPAVFTETAQ